MVNGLSCRVSYPSHCFLHYTKRAANSCRHIVRRNAAFAMVDTHGASVMTASVSASYEAPLLPPLRPTSDLCVPRNRDPTRKDEFMPAFTAFQLHSPSMLLPYHHNIQTIQKDVHSFSEPPPPNRVEPEPEEEGESEISDQEWEIRTGRAIYILQETLPTFFSTGLISSLDIAGPSSQKGNLRSSSDSNGTIHPLITPGSNGGAHPASLTETLLSSLNLKVDKGKGKEEQDKQSQQSESIYSPRVRLEYKSPVSLLPVPLPRTLRVEGLHLYIASSVFVRHTLNALYADLRVDIRRARVLGPPQPKVTAGPGSLQKTKYRCIREKSFFIGLGVSGVGRVSGAPVEWEVNCTYTFSPVTGLIHLHTVDSIEPAPHAALFEALGRFGLVGGGDNTRGAGSGGINGMTPTGCTPGKTGIR